ncbi:cilia- and flagella-associated protein 410-like [Dysidea avara]|uniref:cilia- and flagella-associated protein 410-like n=1 Tax=Dysidea avara TaxID=196820 RepID=UPI003318F66E
MATLDTSFILKRAAAKKLEHVKTLNCWGSNLENVQALQQLENVEVLNLSSNKISTLEDVAYCKSLRELFIRKNKISSFTELEHLKQLPNLTVLWLSENPLVTSTNYRLHVIRTLPHLKKLDNKVITEEERDRARTEVVSSEEKTTSGTNIVTAILCLLKELNKENLLTVRHAIDQQIQEE